MLFEEKMPIDTMTFETAKEFDLSPLTTQLNGGEDYELLFTIKQEDFEKIRNHPDISVIGFIQDKSIGVQVTTRGGSVVPVQAQGWNHFND
jgi:thiamine-monophosphate kinase